VNPSGKQIGSPAPQLASARAGQQEAWRSAGVDEHLQRVEQARQPLHLVDEDQLRPGGGQPLLELSWVLGELEEGGLVREVDLQVG
jgi:hypothetical protein